MVVQVTGGLELCLRTRIKAEKKRLHFECAQNLSTQSMAEAAGACSKAWLTESYVEQTKVWPTRGRHILAQFDDDSIVVYQAYCPEIAEYAVKHQK